MELVEADLQTLNLLRDALPEASLTMWMRVLQTAGKPVPGSVRLLSFFLSHFRVPVHAVCGWRDWGVCRSALCLCRLPTAHC